MRLENFTLGRVCLHEVYRRNDERAIVPPSYGTALLNLAGRDREVFCSRIMAAFKSDAQCLEMTIARFAAGTMAACGVGLTSAPDEGFVQQSRAFADQLASVQVSRALPGGVVAIFDGKVGTTPVPFFAVMKAELQEGFLKGPRLQARLVEDLFLTPKTKLYKIGIFVADSAEPTPLPGGWRAIVYDAGLSAKHRDNAALYFHTTFLGLELPDNSAQQVKKFWAATKDFIKGANITQEKRIDLYNGLYTYLKVDQSTTVQTSKFAETYLTPDLADDYLAFMRRERVPHRAISKDLTEVKGALKLRKFRFASKITLSGPPEAMSELVTVEAVDGGEGAQWTRITVREPIEAQE